MEGSSLPSYTFNAVFEVKSRKAQLMSSVADSGDGCIVTIQLHKARRGRSISEPRGWDHKSKQGYQEDRLVSSIASQSDVQVNELGR